MVMESPTADRYRSKEMLGPTKRLVRTFYALRASFAAFRSSGLEANLQLASEIQLVVAKSFDGRSHIGTKKSYVVSIKNVP